MKLLFAIVLLVGLASSQMPSSFYQAIGSMRSQDVLCVKNYDAGAGFTEAYTGFEYLDKETEVVSRSYNASSSADCTRRNASLEASVASTVIGIAHIAWQSREIEPRLRHLTYGRSTEDLVGVFDIEKFIFLSANGTHPEASLEWLPC